MILFEGFFNLFKKFYSRICQREGDALASEIPYTLEPKALLSDGSIIIHSGFYYTLL